MIYVTLFYVLNAAAVRGPGTCQPVNLQHFLPASTVFDENKLIIINIVLHVPTPSRQLVFGLRVVVIHRRNVQANRSFNMPIQRAVRMRKLTMESPWRRSTLSLRNLSSIILCQLGQESDIARARTIAEAYLLQGVVEW